MRITRVLTALLAAAAVLALSACGGGSKKDAGLGGDAAKGKTLFGETCASCHGNDAKGLVGSGKDLTKSTFADSQTDQQLLDFINKGRAATDPENTTKVDMPARGGNPALTDKDMIDVIAYLRTVSEAKAKK